MHSTRTSCALALMVVAMICVSSEARADGGDGCPDGYAMGARPYMDSSGAMVQNFGCYPIQYREEKYWGAFAYAIYGVNLKTAASWNARTSKEAEKAALGNCKRQLKAEGVKAKCIVAGTGYNGTGWIAWGIGSGLFYGLGKEEALDGCRNAGIEECSIYAKFISDGTDASGLEYLEGANAGAAGAVPANQ